MNQTEEKTLLQAEFERWLNRRSHQHLSATMAYALVAHHDQLSEILDTVHEKARKCPLCRLRIEAYDRHPPW